MVHEYYMLLLEKSGYVDGENHKPLNYSNMETYYWFHRCNEINEKVLDTLILLLVNNSVIPLEVVERSDILSLVMESEVWNNLVYHYKKN